MHFTLGQAAKETGKSKATISKYLNNGKLSFLSKNTSGYKIDAAELFRVFPKSERRTCVNEQLRTPIVNTDLHFKNMELQIKLDAANKDIESLQADKEDYKKRLDDEANERRKLTMILTDQKTDNKKGFFNKMFGS